ncbi:succinic semialdehyde dehydrogenase [Halovivax gelatinilyticus]|uniref:succinic semialdehyde dehydrogenase n=1 Tax=Halovivax gelatinilyticus TaxID=2961597 RepID=UPI0020CA7BA9|nr:succinic semialdehyde dehydrogenase [Halovivax gelatinilyticus]
MNASTGSVFDETRFSADRLGSLGGATGSTDERLRVRTPITDEEIGTVASFQPDDVERAVERVRERQPAWEAMGIQTRAEIVDRFGDLVSNRRAQLLDLVQLETGKTRQHALEEVLDIVLTASYYGAAGPKLFGDERRRGAIPGASDAVVTYDPVGVVGVIAPWNYPLTLSMTDAIPALLAGNAVVCKPDERTPYTALAVASLLEEAGVPDGLVRVVTGDGSTVGPSLIDAVDYVAFTGGTETGRTVAERAGRNLIGCSLELGGKNPLLVLDDADVEVAARGAVKGAFTNAGQLCLAPERVYVHEDRYEAFLDAFVGETRALTLGCSFEYGPDVGSLIDGAHAERVGTSVDEARDSGASVLTGGRRRRDVGPFVYEPTIVTDVDADCPLASEETFGPVVSVSPVSSVDEAVDRANDSAYGLNASVWTGNVERGREIARQIDCGTVCINDPYTVGWAAVDAPMGGVGDSGLGRRHGPEGFDRFVESRTIATARYGPLEPPASLSNRTAARLLAVLTGVQRRIVRWRS